MPTITGVPVTLCPTNGLSLFPFKTFAVPSLKIVHVWEDFSGGNSSKLIDISPVGRAKSCKDESPGWS
jgi:hypothetical protein